MPSPSLTGRDDEDRSLRELRAEIEELVSWLPWFERRKDYPTPYKIAFRALTVLAALSQAKPEAER